MIPAVMAAPLRDGNTFQWVLISLLVALANRLPRDTNRPLTLPFGSLSCKRQIPPNKARNSRGITCSVRFHDITHDATDESDVSVFCVLDSPVLSLLSTHSGDTHEVLGTSSSVSETCVLDAVFSGQSSAL